MDSYEEDRRSLIDIAKSISPNALRYLSKVNEDDVKLITGGHTSGILSFQNRGEFRLRIVTDSWTGWGNSHEDWVIVSVPQAPDGRPMIVHCDSRPSKRQKRA